MFWWVIFDGCFQRKGPVRFLPNFKRSDAQKKKELARKIKSIELPVGNIRFNVNNGRPLRGTKFIWWHLTNQKLSDEPNQPSISNTSQLCETWLSFGLRFIPSKINHLAFAFRCHPWLFFFCLFLRHLTFCISSRRKEKKNWEKSN